MNQVQQLPCLPGYNFNTNVGRTRFNRSMEFDKLHDGVYYLADKSKRSPHDRYPALYAWGELPPRPPWLSLDGQRLMFNAYFQESIHEGRYPYRIRLVNISFFLEDGTIKVSEPSVDNSGLEQGVLVRRQRIPLPDPVKYRYFDILDLNVGREPRIFGRVYKIYNCDKFTRHFLNRMGIPVPDPLEPPANPKHKRVRSTFSQNLGRNKEECNLGNFFKYDGMVLRFFGTWDDSDVPYGYVHNLEVLYYLVDGSMEVIENLPNSGSPAKRSLIVKRSKLPKFFTEIEPIGSSDPLTLLNVLGENVERSYYVTDKSYNDGRSAGGRYYRDCDLAIGAQLNVFGRKVVLADMDDFTKEYYRTKYGLDDFTPLKADDRESDRAERRFQVPPYNGFGSYEDSLVNCFSMVPKRPKIPTDRFFRYENQKNDNRVLRFAAKMISDVPANADRCFVVNVRLFDNAVSIPEIVCERKGRNKSMFQQYARARLPGQNVFTSEEPRYYEPRHFYIGATVTLYGFKFQLVGADEYTFNYMEHHHTEFPMSNVRAIMGKLREALRPVYREFVGAYSPPESDGSPVVLTLSRLREALVEHLGDNVTEHEVLALARRYALCERREPYPREYVRALVHTELNRHVWQELDRLEEDIRDRDREKKGHLGKDELYTILRANRVPLERELIDLMLDRLGKNEQGHVDCSDLICFLNVRINPTTPTLPINLKGIRWTAAEEPKDCNKIDWCSFLKDLGLEERLSGEKPSDA
ncbi:EF-hand domain-containing family member C2-like [Copidosoma floridanum]|uniref:EF-hand domain-containing family member C2-like n=1 Tax=Copidosoma floridanum TaxID=29053 RepID=UPI0006C97C22|nr:EF-hand domain-containing family member C2-like [Copidosoma floridanum]